MTSMNMPGSPASTDAPPTSPSEEGQAIVVLATGRSGAGRTTAINALEDFGFERVDRPPLNIAPEIVSQLQADGRNRVVIGVDAKTNGFSAEAFAALTDAIAANGRATVKVLFLESDEESLRRRYTETRRRHPLAPTGAIEDGIALDRQLTDPVKAAADVVIDTTNMAPAELKRAIREQVLGQNALGLTVSVVSFAYRKGLPADADIVFDCRFLRNPHYEPTLRDHDGREAKVAEYVGQDPLYAPFARQIEEHVLMLLPAFVREGKSYVTIALGCSGGKHRSVATAVALADAIAKAGWRPNLRHRELGVVENGVGPKQTDAA
ncbi:MAG: RNase adapter RapZ [Neomegalonema sp.]|nr:RNase adapter RapZ [Neomegalonema sp.]